MSSLLSQPSFRTLNVRDQITRIVQSPAHGVYDLGIGSKTVARKQQVKSEETQGLSPAFPLPLGCLHRVRASHQQVLYAGVAGSLVIFGRSAPKAGPTEHMLRSLSQTDWGTVRSCLRVCWERQIRRWWSLTSPPHNLLHLPSFPSFFLLGP